jgi:hypothetical protein
VTKPPRKLRVIDDIAGERLARNGIGGTLAHTAQLLSEIAA